MERNRRCRCVSGAARSTRRGGHRTGVAPVHAVVAGVIGSASVVACLRAARRAQVRDRLRSARRTLHIPAPIAAEIARMLDAAALPATVEQACATWAWAVIVAAVLGV